MRRLDVDLREFGWYGGPWNDPTPPPPPPPVPDERHERGVLAGRAPSDPTLRQRVGVVLGRFRPPHLGHMHVVDTAFSQCGALHVVAPGTPGLAADAIHAAFADYADVHVIAPPSPKDPRDPAFLEAWATVVRALSPTPTHLFSSDTFGAKALAHQLGLGHVIVDPTRAAYPIDSTRIRDDLAAHFDWLVPSVRHLFTLQVAVVGPEGSGKTTLATEIGRTFDAPVVEDSLRVEALKHARIPDLAAFCATIEQVPARVGEAARASKRGVVVADDSALLAILFAERLGLRLPERLEHAVEKPDLWLLCHPDFAFQGPKERDEPEARHVMLERLRASLAASEVVHIRGEGRDRVDVAVEAIEAALKDKLARLSLILRQTDVKVP